MMKIRLAIFYSIIIAIAVFAVAFFMYKSAIHAVSPSASLETISLFAPITKNFLFGASFIPAGLFFSATMFYPKNNPPHKFYAALVLVASVFGFVLWMFVLRHTLPEELALEYIPIYRAGISSSIFAAIAFSIVFFRKFK